MNRFSSGVRPTAGLYGVRVGRPLAVVMALLAGFGLRADQSTGPATPGSVIIGRVVEGLSDRPVGEALVELRGRNDPSAQFATTSDSSGTFVFFDVPQGSYGLVANRPGFFFGEYR